MKNKIILLYFLAIAIILVLHSLYLSVVVEDAFIGFRYAKHFAEGDGLIWNIGEPPVEGYTNFLWIIICSVALITGINLIVFVQTVGIILSLLILIYVYSFCSKLIEFGAYVSLIPCIYLALASPFAMWAASGMETTLFTLLVFASCYHDISYFKSRHKISLVLSLGFCFLAVLTRPEGFGIFIILLIMNLFRGWREKESKDIFNYAILAVILFVIPFSIYFLWRVSYYGYLLPLTYYAKTGGGLFQWIRGAKYFFFFTIHFLLPLAPLLIFLFWEKFDQFKGKNFFSISRINSNFESISYGLILSGTICIAYTAYLIVIGGDYMAMYRFFVPILPFIYILVTIVYSQLIKDSDKSNKKYYFILTLVFISFAGTLLQSTPIEKIIFAKPSITHGQYQGVKIERWNTNRLSLIGKYFSDYKSNNNESLATDAIGAISYYSELKIYSIHGLVEPKIAKMELKNLGKGFPGHEKSDLVYTLLKNPTYFMFSRELTMEPANYPIYSEEVKSLLQDEYKLVCNWLVDKKNNEEGYFTFLQRKTLPEK